MDGNTLLRDPLPVPVDGPGGHGIITFRHPQYPPRRNQLFSLARVDRTRNPEHPFGVHHATALQACRIVAGNVSAGRLCLDRSGEEPVEAGEDEILDQDSYYFVLADYAPHSRPYPIVPSFQDWTFPHDAIPDSWLLHGGPRRRLNDRCILTKQGVGLKTAHVVPKGYRDWFVRESMGFYYAGNRGINDNRNLMNIRADIHNLYDAHMFVLVPKREVYTAAGGSHPHTYVPHVLQQDSEVWTMVHNVPVEGIDNTNGEFHFARFAHAILSQLKHFLIMGYPRVVMRDGADGTVVEEVSGEALRSLYGGGGSTGSSALNPRKRRRAEESDEDDGEVGEEMESNTERLSRAGSPCRANFASGLRHAWLVTA